MKTITLECSVCHRKEQVERQYYDPPRVRVLVLKCDRCDTGGGFNESEPQTQPRAESLPGGEKE